MKFLGRREGESRARLEIFAMVLHTLKAEWQLGCVGPHQSQLA